MPLYLAGARNITLFAAKKLANWGIVVFYPQAFYDEVAPYTRVITLGAAAPAATIEA